MSIMINGVNILETVQRLEYLVQCNRLMLEWVLENNREIRTPSSQEKEQLEERATSLIKSKYPGFVRK